ncbi:hypothetical protein [Amycolatopsis alkalitolerans]|uniref:Uncharacterized protein n=1 Tax=Amycolatopsis alkalitolerans TaxID=2547244 RepID=A0A5C4LXA7_9PSEU|nr:hypothetical protein [Amycolatopsis alkalitolerans]TNC24186.1 hypothetical protein FG385_19225 [Amycolatopsis alkalitolerans]
MDEQSSPLSTGTRVTYTVRSECLRGTVAGRPIFDQYTMAVWVPVQPDGASADVEPRLVRKESIIEVAAER